MNINIMSNIKVIKKQKNETITQSVLSIAPFILVLLIGLSSGMQKILQDIFADGGIFLVAALVSKNINVNIQLYKLQFGILLGDDDWGERLKFWTNLVSSALPFFYGGIKCLAFTKFNPPNPDQYYNYITLFSLLVFFITIIIVAFFVRISKSLIELLLQMQPQRIN